MGEGKGGRGRGKGKGRKEERERKEELGKSVLVQGKHILEIHTDGWA